MGFCTLHAAFLTPVLTSVSRDVRSQREIDCHHATADKHVYRAVQGRCSDGWCEADTR